MVGQVSPERPGGRFQVPSRWTVPGWGVWRVPEPEEPPGEPPDNGAGLPSWTTEAPAETPTPPATPPATPAEPAAAPAAVPFRFPKLTGRELTVAAVVLGLVFAGPYLLRRWR